MNSLQRRFDAAYLGLVPIAHKSEGLNVLFCDTIRELLKEGVRVVVHTTNRHFSAVVDALEGNGISSHELDIRVHTVGSLGLKALLAFGVRKRRKRRVLSRTSRAIRQLVLTSVDVVGRVLFWFGDVTIYSLPSRIVALLMLMAFFLPAAALGIVCGVLLGIASFAGLLVSKSFSFILEKARTSLFVRKYSRSVRRQSAPLLGIGLLSALYEKEQIRFAASVSRATDARKLFFFSAFEGAAVKAFPGKTIVAFPDAVTSIFATRFAGLHSAQQMDAIKLSVKHADCLICYSEFVRDEQLRKIFGRDVDQKQVEVIPQGYFASNEDQKPQLSWERLNGRRGLIANLLPELLRGPPHIKFGTFEYVLYPTIDRPHKNVVALIRAFEILLRHKKRNVKLILTTPHITEDVRRTLLSLRLQYDVVFIPSVPLDVLNDLLCGASIMVHSSLAEGGDIFNFSRAVAVGCPALLADIPVVREMFDRDAIPPSAYEQWLFDPVNPIDLAERMNLCLDSVDQIVCSQRKVLRRLSSYGFREMAKRYLEVFERV